MVDAKKRVPSSAKLTRDTIVTVRLDQRVAYFADLAARKQRRSLSGFIEWAIDQSFKSVQISELGYDSEDEYLSNVAYKLWNIDPAERFIRLAINFPDLLNFEEQERWVVLKDSNLLLAARKSSPVDPWNEAILDQFVYPTVRKYWDEMLQAIEDGPAAKRQWIDKMRESYLAGTLYPHLAKPKMPEAPPPAAPPGPAQNFDLDDEIPF